MEPLTKAQKELYDYLVDYLQNRQKAPSIRTMMRAMGLKSPAPIQSRLDHLRRKGYIDWEAGSARKIHIRAGVERLPINGDIVDGFVDAHEQFADVETLELHGLPIKQGDYALRVEGDSLMDMCIQEGDVVIMRPIKDRQNLKVGDIVAASTPDGTTLKYYRQDESTTELAPDNSSCPTKKFSAEQASIQGKLVGVWRSFVDDL